MREAVLVASSRTGLAKSYRGAFNMTRPEDLAAHCVREVLRRTPLLDPAEVEDVILGCGQPIGPQGANIARRATLLAGLSASIPGVTVSRYGASGLEAIAMAAQRIVGEGADAAIAGGVESISLTPRDAAPHPQLATDIPALYAEVGITAEVVAHRYRISRQQQDEYALTSHRRAAKAQAQGLLDEEIVPLYATKALINRKTGEQMGTAEVCCDQDECSRTDCSLEGLLSLGPVFDQTTGKGSVTAGNSAQLADGAAAVLMMSREYADKLGVAYKAIFQGYVLAGCEPEEMGIGPALAVPRLLKRYGLSIDDIDLWEMNEAFAATMVYCRDQLAIPMEKLNVNGGAIALGHPFGMSGCRMAMALTNEMARQRDTQFGIVTTCVVGGMGAAALFEAVH